MKKAYIIAPAIALMLATSACQTRKVERIDPNQVTDLSGRWNDTDSKLVADEMITDALGRPWLKEFNEKMGRKPVVIVGRIRNNTTEPDIQPETFIKDIEKEFINTATVTVVQSKEGRDDLRAEREDQQTFSTEESRKKWGKEKGADFMLMGVINSNVDAYKNEKVVTYKINLELIDLESNIKVWIGDKEIKKYIKN
ncbi:penicillin-binding protein activator LpoB [Oscillatoria amoena NRMC-F 0135]|nr:penicillin-binding protein activator LpoB [Oscillatoria amoena NRMC-F 0135]